MSSFVDRIAHHTRRVIHRNGAVSRQRKKAFERFANKSGLVYFGHVDQVDDDHRLIRGLTTSTSHQDDNYSVGSFDGYDVSLVDRQDTVELPGKHARSHRWVIFEIDLHTSNDLPHIFLGAHTHADASYAKLFTAVPSLQRIPLGTFEPHADEFTSRYSLFATPTQFMEVERLFTAEVTRTIAAHFWPLALEVYNGALYIYSDSLSVNVSLLETMLKNGLWLAQQLDERSYTNDVQQE